MTGREAELSERLPPAAGQRSVAAMSAEENFEAEIARVVGQANAEALVEFFKRAESAWLIKGDSVYKVIETEWMDEADGTISFAVYAEA